jgi:adenylate cyclase
MGEKVERRLAAVMSADMVAFSRLMEFDEESTIRRQKARRAELIDPTIELHHERIVKTTGDGMLVVFDSVIDAVNCAVEIQSAMAARESATPDSARIRYRIGINLGDIINDGGDIFGDGVNIAARL